MSTSTREALYALGIEAANQFLDLNKIERPTYRTHAEQTANTKDDSYAARFFHSVIRHAHPYKSGPITGLYHSGIVWVNVPVTALPVYKPVMRSWSWPGWKTDRTAVGVVAHEVGHHVEAVRVCRMKEGKDLAINWRIGLQQHRKTVSGYEPVPSEAWAETMRLFILNPDLLRKAIPWRYSFLLALELQPVESLLKKGWRRVLGNKEYEAAAERWIGARQ